MRRAAERLVQSHGKGVVGLGSWGGLPPVYDKVPGKVTAFAGLSTPQKPISLKGSFFFQLYIQASTPSAHGAWGDLHR